MLPPNEAFVIRNGGGRTAEESVVRTLALIQVLSEVKEIKVVHHTGKYTHTHTQRERERESCRFLVGSYTILNKSLLTVLGGFFFGEQIAAPLPIPTPGSTA